MGGRYGDAGHIGVRNMKNSLIVGVSIIIAAVILSGTALSLLRYDTEWKGKTLVKIDRLTGKIETCSPMGGTLLCLQALNQNQ